MGRYVGQAGGRPVAITGAPVAGTNAVQTLTIGGTPTGGSFTITVEGFTTAAIPWNSTNATLLASINSALDALPNVPNSGIVATAGTLTAGIGTIVLTCSGGSMARRPVSLMTATSSLTGTSPTVAIANTTTGVEATLRDAATGVLAIRDNGTLYSNTSSTLFSPTWTVVGTQT